MNRQLGNGNSLSKRILKRVCTVLLFSFVSLTANALGEPGLTPGSLGVSPTGAAEYSVPLAIPPGTAGMAPTLSLNYNSQGGNGPLGVGWSVGGLSAITRCPKTLAKDGVIRGVKLDINDNYCLDGQRLIPITGTTNQYRTEIETFSHITSHSNNGVLYYFIVKTKAGQTMEYGRSLDSRIEAQNTSQVRVWALNRIEDTFTNYIDFIYQEEVTSYRIDRIEYTGNINKGLSPYSSVQFEYVDRADQATGYYTGNEFKQKKIISHIRTYTDRYATLVKDYRLSYENNGTSQRSRLTAIQECNATGQCFNPNMFEWEAKETVASTFTNTTIPDMYFTINGKDTGTRLADINGDGLTDLVQIYYPEGSEYGGHPQRKVLLNTGSDYVYDATYSDSLPDMYFTIRGQDTGTRLVDLNGDGLTDLLQIHYPSSGWYSGQPQRRVFLNTGSKFVANATYSASVPDTYFTIRGQDTGTRLADINGDGLTDLIQIHYPSSGWYSGQPQHRVFLNTGTNFVADSAYSASVPDTYFTIRGQDTGTRLADLNGDGLTDLIQIHYPESGWYSGQPQHRVFLNTGTNFVGDSAYSASVPDTYFTIRGQDTGTRLTDINGDGLTDLVQIHYPESGWYGGQPQRRVFLNTGRNYVYDGAHSTSLPDVYFTIRGQDTGTRLADLNGDGLTDLIQIHSPGSGWYGGQPQRRAFLSKKDKNVISKITNSLNSESYISYKPLTDNSVYTKDATASYPTLEIQAPMFVVSSVTTDNGIGGQNEISYTYAGAKAHMHGLGFLGFRLIQSVAQETGIITRTGYRQDYPYLGMVHWTATHQADWKIINFIENFNSVHNYGDGRYFPYVKTSVQKSYEIYGNLLTTVNTDYVYDTFGNPTDITVSTTGNGQTFTTSTVNTYTNLDNPTKWYLGRLTRASVTQSGTGMTPQTRVSAFGYDLSGHGLLNVETVEPDRDQATGLKLSTQYQYDEYGNKKYVVTDGGLSTAARSTTTSYTGGGHNPGQFPISVTNALGQSESHTFDARFGVMTSLIGPNSLTTNWEYDGFGRQVKEKRADGTETKIDRYWCIDCGPNYSLLKATSLTGGGYVHEYSDRLGRVIQTNRPGRIKGASNHDRNDIFDLTFYNTKGQVEKKSDPVYTGGSFVWNYYEYDDLGRLFEERDNNGLKIIYTHNGFTTQVTNKLNQTTTRITNARGELVQVIDVHQNPTSYFYDALGNQVRVEDAFGNTTSLTYDIRGNKTAMNDPDMGSWTYDYNAYGELVSQTDAKSQTTTMKYDKLGRMIERTDPECTSFWVYGSSNNSGSTGGKAIGKLVYTQRGDKEKIYTTYDQYGRPNQVTTRLFNKTFTTQTSYDSASRVDEITYPASIDYPTGLKVKNHYDSNGYLETVSDGLGFKYWEALDQNARGQVTSFSMGNAATSTERYYNPTNGLVESITTGNNQSYNDLQSLGFDFDVLGNLKERRGLTTATSLRETFTYDNLNRLRTSTVDGQNTKEYRYDALGNITFKTGVGNYSYGYGNAGPHAVTKTDIGNKDYTYDDNGNMTYGDGRNIIWSPYNKPIHITQSGNTSEFAYGANRNRIRQITDEKTTYYVNSLFEYEEGINGDVATHYIKAGGSTIATIKSYENGTAKETRYLHKDHLGGIEAISREDGSLVNQLSYDPHGKRRNADWTDANGSLPEYDINRGFTGHEHLDNVGLIHMNGRVYDPTLGRFISADPYVQFPESGQSLNRYSYVMNNPLSFTDPSGFGLFSFIKKIFKNKVFRAVVAIVVAVVTQQYYLANVSGTATVGSYVAAGAAGGAAGGFVASGGRINGAIQGGIVGGFSGFIGASGAFSSTFAKGVAHGVVGGAQSAVNGGKFLRGFASSFFSKLASGKIHDRFGDSHFGKTAGAFANAVVGGTTSVIGGGKFGNGAYTSAFQYLFNEVAKVARKAEYGIQRAHAASRELVRIRGLSDEEFTEEFAEYGFTPTKELAASVMTARGTIRNALLTDSILTGIAKKMQPGAMDLSIEAAKFAVEIKGIHVSGAFDLLNFTTWLPSNRVDFVFEYRCLVACKVMNIYEYSNE